ncbi:hypothetical protein [Aestuariispira insulae]|uniref:Uncharacterized protein n=1 Tax=Aestuariispira insulae TaxID=1461337 RepID=A0A3D9HRP8_9PROT|nr:hypothetical protein [Aestuariispira insulae]RED52168.1 hypothetical protein DFP90_102186 [Aestuariispira insulae]
MSDQRQNFTYYDPKTGRFTGGRIGAVEGYPEKGSTAWRASNDRIFIKAVNDYNRSFGYRPGDDGFWTPHLLKTQAMIEAGGSHHKEAFLSDPLQVNKPLDWVPRKASLLGLERGDKMTPETSAKAALLWLDYKGWQHDGNGDKTRWEGNAKALFDYNGNRAIHPKTGGEHRQWYADRISEMAGNMLAAQGLDPHGRHNSASWSADGQSLDLMAREGDDPSGF